MTIVDRFIKYARIDTQSDENSTQTPSTQKQFNLAKEVEKEALEMGLVDVSLDNNCYFMATLPSNTNKKVPVIGFISHFDTSPDMSGNNVNPRIVKNYDGKDIVLNETNNVVLSPNDFPELLSHKGEDIIVTDGTTLLGADDKAGIAEIMSAMQHLIDHPEIEHGKIRIAFTPDEEIGQNMKPGTFISLESTTYPTTTENLMMPILERESGLKQGVDFWLAYSPERVDPGNDTYKTKNTPKVLGAMSDDGLEIGEAIYKKAIQNVHLVSSPRVAEMVKILENTYRLINISLINELALLAGKMDVNIWEVIDAAKTKPFGFQAFYPGPGIGGHCIPLDPFYLEYIAKQYDFDLTMIHTAGHINMRMPHYMYIKIASALNKYEKSVSGSKILFLGVAYKPNIDDERESPALEIIDTVTAKGGLVSYNDPYIPMIKTHNGVSLKSVELTPETLSRADVVVITTNHRDYDSDFIMKHSNLIVDLRNVMTPDDKNKVFKL
jgi:UDP-N-acetyl-D-glucosamine dehydrogenase